MGRKSAAALQLGLWIGLLAFAGCRSGAPDEAPRGRAGLIPAVEAVQARSGGLPLRERLTGTVRAAGEVAIFPETSGPVAEVFAQNGDTVKKGDPLVRIHATGAQPQLAQARSSLQVAEAELRQAETRLEEIETQFERTRALGEKGLLPRDTVDSQRAQLESARAEVARAKAQVGLARNTVAERAEVQQQTLVRAPIDGQVGQRNVEVGMRVDPQTPLFVMGRLENMRVEVPVTQEILTHVRPGQRVELGPGGGAPPLPAAVSRISPFLQPGSYSATVEIDVPNEAGRLVPGMFVTVDVYYGETETVTLVPVSAIADHPRTGERGVYVASEPPEAVPAAHQSGEAAPLPEPIPVPFRPVQVLAEGPEAIGVDGIQPGEWVVVVGQHLLAESAGAEAPHARVRAIEWQRIMELQGLQREDLLRQFMDRQRRLATEDQRTAAETRAPGG